MAGELSIPGVVESDSDDPGALWAIAVYHPDFGSGYSELPLGELDTGAPIEIELVRGQTLQGTIIDPDGRPIPGAKIGVETQWVAGDVPLRGSLVTLTKEDGSFSLAGIRFGNVPLNVGILYPVPERPSEEGMDPDTYSAERQRVLQAEENAPRVHVLPEHFSETAQAWNVGTVVLQRAPSGQGGQ